MDPWMSFREIEIIEAALLAVDKPHLEILEWGCGGSTLHFTKMLTDKGRSFHWTSVEHNRAWYEDIAAQIGQRDNIELHWFDAEGDDRKALQDTPMQDYVNFPASLQKKFDLILVDGRKRRQCMAAAVNLITDDGAVYLHDALRPEYHGAFSSYPEGHFVSLKLWRGIRKPAGIGRRIANFWNYVYYRYLVKKLYRMYRNRLQRRNIPFDYQQSRW